MKNEMYPEETIGFGTYSSDQPKSEMDRLFSKKEINLLLDAKEDLFNDFEGSEGEIEFSELNFWKDYVSDKKLFDTNQITFINKEWGLK